MATKADPITTALAKLAKAQKRLADGQGMVARANARKEVLARLREYRRVLDRDFPYIPKKRKPKRKRTKIRDGYVPLTTTAFGADYARYLTWMAEAKISIQVIAKATPSAHAGTYVPEWAIAICARFGDQTLGRSAPSNLRRAKKDRSFREVELAAYKLGQDHFSS